MVRLVVGAVVILALLIMGGVIPAPFSSKPDDYPGSSTTLSEPTAGECVSASPKALEVYEKVSDYQYLQASQPRGSKYYTSVVMYDAGTCLFSLYGIQPHRQGKVAVSVTDDSLEVEGGKFVRIGRDEARVYNVTFDGDPNECTAKLAPEIRVKSDDTRAITIRCLG